MNDGGVGGNRAMEPGVWVPGEQALQGGGELRARLGLHMTRKGWTTSSRWEEELKVVELIAV